MRQVTVREATTQLSLLLEAVEAGERIVISRDGEPVAVLSPYRCRIQRRPLGLFAGEATPHDDFDDLPADIATAFGEPR